MALLIKDLIEIEKLPKGGMGEIYRATQVSFNRKIILKYIAQRLFSNRHQIEQFENTARLSASLDHENIVQIYDFGLEKDTFYFVTEYIDGPDLEKLFAWKQFPWPIGLLIAVEALKGLNFAHKKGLAHGGFKSNNILVSKTGQIKVADFGLAHQSSQALFQNKEDIRFITAAYMPPEVAKRIEEIEINRSKLLETARSTEKSMSVEENPELEGKDISRDIWSAGVLLYRVFCGQLPFSGETFSEMAQSIKNSREPIFFHFMPFLPDDCANAINACLAKEPQSRPSSLDSLIQSLEILISEIGFRDSKNEIQKYLVDKYSAINELEKVLLRYHSQMAIKCRQSGDAFKQAAHVVEIEKFGDEGESVIRLNSFEPPDSPEQIQATNFFIPEKTEPKIRSRALKITIATSVIIFVSIVLGISFTALQKNSATNEEYRYAQKAEMASVQAPQSQAKPEISIPDTIKPPPAPIATPVLQTQHPLPKETAPTRAPRRKSGGLANSGKKSAETPAARPAPDKSAILKVNIRPVTAIVQLDEKDISLQEIISGKSMTAGPHVISVSAPGYESYQNSITIEAGTKQIMDISLTQKEKGAGLLQVYSYPWADIYVDGVRQGTTPTAKPLSFMEGEHELQLRRQGFKLYSKTVDVIKGQVTHIQVNLEEGDPAGH